MAKAKVIQLKARLHKDTTCKDLTRQGIKLKAKPCVVDKSKPRQSFVSPLITFTKPTGGNGPDLVA